ncbi:MAG TPA: hypothetical protein EYP53_10265 [Candidatus Latescibacteria bacterium]|nr:hypothetical protein [Candidatus Latescibacterota bacterium]
MKIIPLLIVLLTVFLFLLALIIAGLNSIRERKWEKFRQALLRGNVPEGRKILRRLYPLRSSQEKEMLERILKETGYPHLSLEELSRKA